MIVVASLILLAIILSAIRLTVVLKSPRSDNAEARTVKPTGGVLPMQGLYIKTIQGLMVKDAQRRIINESI